MQTCEHAWHDVLNGGWRGPKDRRWGVEGIPPESARGFSDNPGGPLRALSEHLKHTARAKSERTRSVGRALPKESHGAPGRGGDFKYLP